MVMRKTATALRLKLLDVITNGLPGTTMSAWKQVLTEEEIETIIAYINRAFYPTPGMPELP